MADGLRQRWLALPGGLRGTLWMLAAAFFFASHGPLVRLASVDLDPLVVAFLRSVALFALMLPWIVAHGREAVRTRHPVGHFVRAATSLVGLVLLVLAQANLPLAEVSAISFAAPLFGVFGAALVLRETVRARRWIATLVGFAGVWIVLRPGLAGVDPLFVLPLVSAVFVAVSNLMTKTLSRTESATAIVAWLAVLSVPLTLVPALFVWSWPSAWALLWTGLMGIAGFGAHQCLSRSLAAADASAVMPYDYMRLVITATLAYVIFGEVPAIWTWIGGAVIVGAVVYIARREAQSARAAAVAARKDMASSH